MSKYTYKEIIKQARLLKKNVEKEQKMGMNSRWAYYFAKAIKKPNTSIQNYHLKKRKIQLVITSAEMYPKQTI